MVVQGLHDPSTGQPIIEPDLARSIGERVAAIMAEQHASALPPAQPIEVLAVISGEAPAPAFPALPNPENTAMEELAA